MLGMVVFNTTQGATQLIVVSLAQLKVKVDWEKEWLEKANTNKNAGNKFLIVANSLKDKKYTMLRIVSLVDYSPGFCNDSASFNFCCSFPVRICQNITKSEPRL